MALNLKVLRTCKFDRLQPCGIAFMLINSCGGKKKRSKVKTLWKVFLAHWDRVGESLAMLYPPRQRRMIYLNQI